MTSDNGDSARARLIKTRRGTQIDKRLLPAVQRECLEILREAAREAVGEETYLPAWIADASDSVDIDVDQLSMERISRKPTPAEEKMEEEVDATIDMLEERGGFEELTWLERFEFEMHVRDRIRSKYESQIACEAEEARKKKRWPKSNPSLVTEKDILNFALDELHRRGVLDQITVTDSLRAPLEEEHAWLLALKARKTARVCGCCGRELSLKEPAYLGVDVYVGMWALYWDRVSKPQICKHRYERTVLCEACAPEWLSPERDDVFTQLCAHCERPMVSRMTLSLRRTFCSDSCQRAYHNQLRKEKRAEEREKVCEVCGEEFAATRQDAKTCSRKCKQKAYRRRKREVD